jgi:carboxypeptidase family protein
MRTLIGMALAILLLLGLGFAQGSSLALGSIRGDVFTKGTNGEPVVLPGARIVLRGPITKETESDTQGAFGIDGLPPGTYEIEANAPGLYAALAVEVRAGTSSTVPVEMNVAAVTSTTSPQLTRLKAMDCAFSRKVHHA